MLVNTVKDLFNSGKLSKDVARYAFDWMRAAKIIAKRKPYVAYAGYLHSFKRINYLIYQGGIPVYPTELFLTDKDIPVLILDGNENEPIPCYVKEYEDYQITWTPESLKLLTTKIDTKEHGHDTGRKNDSKGTD